jgi:hypothetical protein
VNGVSASASVFAEATPRQILLRPASYDGTRQPTIVRRHLIANTILMTKADFVVKINILCLGAFVAI